MPHKLRVLVLSGKQGADVPLKEVMGNDIVILRSDRTDKGSEYEVVRNRFGDHGGYLSDEVVHKFLDACGVRSAT